MAGRLHPVLNNISFTVPKGDKLAILGRNGAGKSTLIRLLGQVELPTSGSIAQTMSLSWPIGLTGGFQGSLTGNDNMRFIARIYNKPFSDIKAYVDDFAERQTSKDPVRRTGEHFEREGITIRVTRRSSIQRHRCLAAIGG